MLEREDVLSRLRPGSRWIVLGILWLLVPACGTEAATGKPRGGNRPSDSQSEAYPTLGTTPLAPIGGLIEIPGSPLPPLPRESVENAIPIYEAMIAGWRLMFGNEHPSIARGQVYLATLYAGLGAVAKSEQHFDDAQRILEKRGTEGRDLGWLHNSRGLARLARREYAPAASSFRSSIRALRAEGRELVEIRPIPLQNLASVYHLLGDVEASEEAYLQALVILRRLGQEQSREYQTTSQNLAMLYSALGDHAAARRTLEDLLSRGAIRGSDLHFAILNNLGHALRHLRELRAAAARFEQARAFTAEGSPERLLVLMNLAALFSDAGELARAGRAADEALRLAQLLHGPGSAAVAEVEASLGTLALARGDLPGAEKLLTRAKSVLSGSSENRPAVRAAIDRELAIVAQRQGQRERAVQLSREALAFEVEHLDRILTFGSEAQRLAYQRGASFYDQIANLGEASLLAEAILKTKGAVLESLLLERALVRRSTSPRDRERLDRIHDLKVAVMEEVARGDSASRARREELERALKQEETNLAKSLALPLRRGRQSASLVQVQAALGSGEVLIELVRFEQYAAGTGLVSHYGALLVPRQGRPSWIPLGAAAGLEAAVEGLVRQMDRGGRGATPIGAGGDPAAPLRGLYDRLWKPLRTALPAGTRRVLLAPDGALHLVPWAALLDESGTFVAERWQMAQLGSGRDLLRPAPPSSDKTILALADGSGDLPFSRKEVAALKRLAAGRGWRTTTLLGAQASERELFKHHHPRILHLATHGGLLGEQESAIAAHLGRQPMYRGYLVLGGAADSFAAWKRGSVPPLAGDNILTAEEVGGLDLSHTWLTVLSACKTGDGDARRGEGILGLRRGFALAGTEYLLFTLWSVDDSATARFMERFYERLFASGNPALAFHEVQLGELRRLRQEHGLAPAVFLAGGLVLTR